MKYLFAIILVITSSWTDLDKIAKVNKLKKEAKEAYNNGNYQKALDNYTYLIDSMKVHDDNIVLNMANAYYKLNDMTNAVSNYEAVADSKDNVISSVAQQQLGVIANRSKKFKEALEHFKEALKADPANEEARYNYELLKKVLKEQEEQNKDQKNKDQQDQQKQDQQKEDQQKQDQQEKGDQEQQQDQEKDSKGDEKEDQEQKDKKDGEKKEDGEPKDEEKQKPEDGEESDEENKDKQDQMSSAADKLEEMKISEEKAKMILEALKNKEIQYYQQNKRKATKPREANKPDW